MTNNIPITNIKPSNLTKIMDTIENNVCHFSISQIKALERLIRIKNIEITGGELDGTPIILLPNKLGLTVKLTRLKNSMAPYMVKYQLLKINQAD